MRSFFFACCLLAIVLTACGDKNKTPKGILPREKMQSVIWDMLRAGEFINGYVLPGDTGAGRGTRSLAVYEQVLSAHKISRQQYDESFAWYREHPGEMKRLLDTLSKLPYTGDTATANKRTITDSLKKLPALQMPDSLMRAKQERRQSIIPKKLVE